MNIKRLIIAVILFVGFVILHKGIQNNALDLGFSWTLSSVSPYVLQFITAILLAYQVALILNKKNKLLRRIVLIGGVIILCGVAFAVNSIYEGDFSNDYEKVEFSNTDEKILDEGLTMIALPGCPYCIGKIPLLNKLKTREKNLPIQVVIIKEDSLTKEYYQEELNENISVQFTSHVEDLAKAAEGRFPSFFHTKKNGEVIVWTRTGFGTRAFDWLENSVE